MAHLPRQFAALQIDFSFQESNPNAILKIKRHRSCRVPLDDRAMGVVCSPRGSPAAIAW